MDSHQNMDNLGSGDVTPKDKWDAIRDAIKQYVGSQEAEYQELLDEKYQQVLETYYLLSTKLMPSDEEADWLSSILEDAEGNRELAILLAIVDDVTFDEMGYNESNYKADFEKSRKRTRQRISQIYSDYYSQISLLETPSEQTNQAVQATVPKRLHENFVGLLPSMQGHRQTFRQSLRLGVAGTGLFVAFSALGNFLLTDGLVQERYRQSTEKSLLQGHSEDGAVSTTFYSSNCIEKPVGWIADSFDGNRTAYGETYSTLEYTAAHPFLPPQSEVYLQPKDTQANDTAQPVKVRITDKGSIGASTEGLLVSHQTARDLDIVDDGVAKVSIERVVINKNAQGLLTAKQTALLTEFINNCAAVIDNAAQSTTSNVSLGH